MRGSGEDRLQSVQQSSDGGYILGGYPTSGVSGNKTNAGFGGWDFWAIKVASAENKQWEAVTEKMIVAKAAECLLPLRQGLWTSEPPAAARWCAALGEAPVSWKCFFVMHYAPKIPAYIDLALFCGPDGCTEPAGWAA